MAFESYNIVCFTINLLKVIELKMKKWKKKEKQNEKELKTIKIWPKKVLKYFLAVSMKKRWLFLVIILGWVLTAFVSLYLPILYSSMIDTISDSEFTNKMDLVPSLLQILLFILLAAFISMSAWIVVGMGTIPFEIKWIKHIFAESFKYIHRHSYRFFTNNFGWSLVKKVNKLAYSYERIVDIFVFNILRLIIVLPVIVITISTKNIILWAIFFVFILLFGIFQYIMYKKNIPFEIKSNEHDSKITWELSDTITNNLNILTFASHIKEFKSFFKTLSQWEKIKKKTRYRWEYIHIGWMALMIIFEITTMYFAINFWWQSVISTGTIVLLQVYIFKIFEQMFNLWQIFKRFNNIIWESTEMIEVLETPHEIIDQKWAKNMQIKSWKIEFKDVTFAYNKWNNIFKELSLRIKPGEKVAFVGESGSGKTSIVKLLLRFFDIQSGEILIDGQDIAKVTQDSLRNSISLVPQEPILFHRTLKENIAYGNPDASEEEILAASKMARCHRFIKKLPEQYDTLVWERWIKLSGGERQRVAIARAILENKSILVLDEATSALDSESEMLIQEAMANLIRKKTTIIVAHRLSTIMNMDKIIVMAQWKIVEIWTHKELLLNKDWIYKNLWDIQSGWFRW